MKPLDSYSLMLSSISEDDESGVDLLDYSAIILVSDINMKAVEQC